MTPDPSALAAAPPGARRGAVDGRIGPVATRGCRPTTPPRTAPGGRRIVSAAGASGVGRRRSPPRALRHCACWPAGRRPPRVCVGRTRLSQRFGGRRGERGCPPTRQIADAAPRPGVWRPRDSGCVWRPHPADRRGRGRVRLMQRGEGCPTFATPVAVPPRWRHDGVRDAVGVGLGTPDGAPLACAPGRGADGGGLVRAREWETRPCAWCSVCGALVRRPSGCWSAARRQSVGATTVSWWDGGRLIQQSAVPRTLSRAASTPVTTVGLGARGRAVRCWGDRGRSCGGPLPGGVDAVPAPLSPSDRHAGVAPRRPPPHPCAGEHAVPRRGLVVLGVCGHERRLAPWRTAACAAWQGGGADRSGRVWEPLVPTAGEQCGGRRASPEATAEQGRRSGGWRRGLSAGYGGAANRDVPVDPKRGQHVRVELALGVEGRCSWEQPPSSADSSRFSVVVWKADAWEACGKQGDVRDWCGCSPSGYRRSSAWVAAWTWQLASCTNWCQASCVGQGGEGDVQDWRPRRTRVVFQGIIAWVERSGRRGSSTSEGSPVGFGRQSVAVGTGDIGRRAGFGRSVMHLRLTWPSGAGWLPDEHAGHTGCWCLVAPRDLGTASPVPPMGRRTPRMPTRVGSTRALDDVLWVECSVARAGIRYTIRSCAVGGGVDAGGSSFSFRGCDSRWESETIPEEGRERRARDVNMHFEAKPMSPVSVNNCKRALRVGRLGERRTIRSWTSAIDRTAPPSMAAS